MSKPGFSLELLGLVRDFILVFVFYEPSQESTVLADDNNEVEDRVFSMSDPVRNPDWQNGHGSHLSIPIKLIIIKIIFLTHRHPIRIFRLKN